MRDYMKENGKELQNSIKILLCDEISSHHVTENIGLMGAAFGQLMDSDILLEG